MRGRTGGVGQSERAWRVVLHHRLQAAIAETEIDIETRARLIIRKPRARGAGYWVDSVTPRVRAWGFTPADALHAAGIMHTGVLMVLAEVNGEIETFEQDVAEELIQENPDAADRWRRLAAAPPEAGEMGWMIGEDGVTDTYWGIDRTGPAPRNNIKTPREPDRAYRLVL